MSVPHCFPVCFEPEKKGAAGAALKRSISSVHVCAYSGSTQIFHNVAILYHVRIIVSCIAIDSSLRHSPGHVPEVNFVQRIYLAC